MKKRTNPNTSILLTAIAATLLAGENAWAADLRRVAVDGDFETAAAWSPTNKPVAGDHAIFAADGSGTVAFNGNEASDTFAVNATNYTWDLNGNTYTLGGTTDRNRIDLGGHLTVTSTSAGGTVQNNVNTGDADPGLNVGRNGVGTLILNGANVTWNNPSDRVYVGSEGAASVGVLEVRNGATFDVGGANQTMIGRLADATGTVRVDGANSLFDAGAGDTFIGNQGNGTLEITDGGRFNADFTSVLAAAANGTVWVDGAGSLFAMNNKSLEIGNTGASVADITVTAGGNFGSQTTFPSTYINRIEAGRVAGSTVDITVDGAGSKFFAEFIYLGGRNSGGPFGTAHATISSGGVLRVHKQLTVYSGSTVTLDGGTVEYGNTSGGNSLELRGTLAGSGNVNNIGGGADALIATGATFDPGTDTGAGTLGFLEYNFTNDAATVFEVDIFGNGGASWDVLAITNVPLHSTAGFIELNGGTVDVTTSAGGLDFHPVGFDLVVGQTVTVNTMPTLSLPAGYAGNLVHATTGGLLQANQESLRLVITDSPSAPTDFSITNVTANAAAQEVVITWESESNQTYTLRRATNLVSGFDTELTNGFPATSASSTYTDDVTSIPSAAYRVERE